MIKILLIEDDKDIAEILKFNLVNEGYLFKYQENAQNIIKYIEQEKPHLILLDLMLPHTNGLDICKMLKKHKSLFSIPIIMLTAKSEDSDVITGLELGADDYVIKPFSVKVLLARIRNVIRKNYTENNWKFDNITNLSWSDIEIYKERMDVYVNKIKIHLTSTEFQILSFLAENAGRVYTREQIIDAIKGVNYIVTDRTVDVQIVSLRKKLGVADYRIATIRGIGYKFDNLQ